MDVLRWNVDKASLRDLQRAGLPVVPTVWDPVDLTGLPAAEWVVKPSVSAASRDTARWTDPDDALAHAAALTGAGRTAMVQPYLAGVDDIGETAMLFFGGRFSHAVRKGPLLQQGEGVRQDRDGREVLARVEATRTQLSVAQAVLGTVGSLAGTTTAALYARIDLVADDSGRPVVLELERTEPSLVLPQAPHAAEAFARAVQAELSR